MPTRDAYGSDYNLVHLDLCEMDEMFADGESATRQQAEPSQERVVALNELRAAVLQARAKFTEIEELVFTLRFEVVPRWTQKRIALATHTDQSWISLTEQRVLAGIRAAFTHGKGV